MLKVVVEAKEIEAILHTSRQQLPLDSTTTKTYLIDKRFPVVSSQPFVANSLSKTKIYFFKPDVENISSEGGCDGPIHVPCDGMHLSACTIALSRGSQ